MRLKFANKRRVRLLLLFTNFISFLPFSSSLLISFYLPRTFTFSFSTPFSTPSLPLITSLIIYRCRIFLYLFFFSIKLSSFLNLTALSSDDDELATSASTKRTTIAIEKTMIIQSRIRRQHLDYRGKHRVTDNSTTCTRGVHTGEPNRAEPKTSATAGQ